MPFIIWLRPGERAVFGAWYALLRPLRSSLSSLPCCSPYALLKVLGANLVQVVFYIVDLTVTSYVFDNFNTIGQTLLVSSLPLSTLWASAEVKENGLMDHSLGLPDSNLSRSRSKFSIFYKRNKSNECSSDIEKASSSGATNGSRIPRTTFSNFDYPDGYSN